MTQIATTMAVAVAIYRARGRAASAAKYQTLTQVAAAMAAAVAIHSASGPRGGEVNETVSSEPLLH